jgi:hypothetical protein
MGFTIKNILRKLYPPVTALIKLITYIQTWTCQRLMKLSRKKSRIPLHRAFLFKVLGFTGRSRKKLVSQLFRKPGKASEAQGCRR